MSKINLLFDNITEKDKTGAIRSLIDDSTPRPSFFFLVIMSGLMAACGLLINNTSIVIASMLIAPILSPILSLSLGVVTADHKLISRSSITLLKSIGFVIGFSALITWLLWSFTSGDNFSTNLNPEIISRIKPSLVYLLVAIIAGIATSFAKVKPELSATLPGTAIAVALVPPLATVGIGIATFRLDVISGALGMFLLNIIGIVAAAILMFSLMNIYNKKNVIIDSVEKADQELKEKIKQAEKSKE